MVKCTFAILIGCLSATGYASCWEDLPRMNRNGLDVKVMLTATDIMNVSSRFSRILSFKLKPKFESGCVLTQKETTLIVNPQVEIITSKGQRTVGVFDGGRRFSFSRDPDVTHIGLPDMLKAHSAVIATLIQDAGFESFESAEAGSYGPITMLLETTGSKYGPAMILMGSGSKAGRIYQIMVDGIQINVGE